MTDLSRVLITVLLAAAVQPETPTFGAAGPAWASGSAKVEVANTCCTYMGPRCQLKGKRNTRPKRPVGEACACMNAAPKGGSGRVCKP